MRMTNGMSDLELTLYKGNTQDVPTNNPAELQRLYFNTDLIRVRGVGNQFQKTTADSYKSDREMTVCEMQAAQDKARSEHELARADFEKKLAKLRTENAQLSKELRDAETKAPLGIGHGTLYCHSLALHLLKSGQAHGVSGTV